MHRWVRCLRFRWVLPERETRRQVLLGQLSREQLEDVVRATRGDVVERPQLNGYDEDGPKSRLLNGPTTIRRALRRDAGRSAPERVAAAAVLEVAHSRETPLLVAVTRPTPPKHGSSVTTGS
jgi:hypothetical protein